jgi:anti-sigma factor RsiW
MSHEPFAASVAAYALDALDTQDAREFEMHLASCPECQHELAQYRDVTTQLGLAIEPESPPAELKARTMARAVAQPPTAPSRRGDDGAHIVRPVFGATVDGAAEAKPRRSASPWAWTAVAASLAGLLAVSAYAWSLRVQTADLRQQLQSAIDRAERLRADLVAARRDAGQLQNTTNVIRAPDLLTISLRGRPGALKASGHALVSAGSGLIVRAGGLPPLQPGRVYQLWVIPPTRSGAPAPAPVGVGVLMADASGAYVLETGALPSAASAVSLLAVTNEPGPTGSTGPTTPILLVGQAES